MMPLILYGSIVAFGIAFFFLVKLMSQNMPVTGGKNGQYRQASSSGNSGSTHISGSSAGRTATIPPDPFYEAVRDAVSSGTIPASAARAYYSYLKNGGTAVTVPGTHSGNYLGAGYQQAAQQSAMNQAALMNYAVQQYPGGLTFVSGAPHSPTDLKSEAMIAGEIIAWRAWKVVDGGLASVVADVAPWSTTEPIYGDPAGGYGIHAYKGPHGPLLDGYVQKDNGKWVIGEVALWGDVIEHEEGYRAEFARVHSLVTWSDNVPKEQRDLITAAYLTRAPVHKIDDAA